MRKGFLKTEEGHRSREDSLGGEYLPKVTADNFQSPILALDGRGFTLARGPSEEREKSTNGGEGG